MSPSEDWWDSNSSTLTHRARGAGWNLCNAFPGIQQNKQVHKMCIFRIIFYYVSDDQVTKGQGGVLRDVLGPV